jgi:hypothetical protein
VHALNVFTRRGRAFDDVEPLEQDGQPLARVRVRLVRVELCQRRMAYDVRLTASASVSRSAPPACARPTR